MKALTGPVRSTFAFLLLAASVAAAAPVNFDIPPQPAADALVLFSKQSGEDVLYSATELKKVTANAVTGEFEPAAALGILLKNTGFVSRRNGGGKFIVSAERIAATVASTIRGALIGGDGRPAAGVTVRVIETHKSAVTDRNGGYVLAGMEPGSYTLIATAAGYQPLHITEVQLRHGTDLVVGPLRMRAVSPTEDVTRMDPYLVVADSVTEMDPFEVTGSRPKPYIGTNVDIPRTMNDIQPYFVFDGEAIDRSGAFNAEDFLREQVTMNAAAAPSAQGAGLSVLGNLSSIDLRGVGGDKTLVLINGRQLASTVYAASANDLNAIPLNAIERIEVLPTSASGIYGGSAIGGVVNVVLKKNYSGGDVRVTYDNTTDGDAARLTLAANFGVALEGGRTQLNVTASRSEANTLLLGDRVDGFAPVVRKILENNPALLYSATSPFLGALPNITAQSATQTTLTLRNGAVINSRNTFVAAGTAPDTPASQLYSSLQAGGGSWNFDLPETAQYPDGLARQVAATPQTDSILVGVRRRMTPRVEMFADFTYRVNRSRTNYAGLNSALTVPATVPTNPFTTAVNVQLPNTAGSPIVTSYATRTATLGAVVKLPREWSGQFDYTWSENRYRWQYHTQDTTARTADLASGALNPFVDVSRHPLDLERYNTVFSSRGLTTQHNVALRGSGPIPAPPWGGRPNLTLGFDYRFMDTPAATGYNIFPVTPASSTQTRNYPRQAAIASGYGEVAVPLIKKDWRPLLRSLELQLAGRYDYYAVDTGTTSATTRLQSGVVTFSGPVRGGQPFFDETNYRSNKFTVGIKYQPFSSVIVRASHATAFLPPTPAQLAPSNEPSLTTTNVTDPRNGALTPVQTVSGGNPDLAPQTSRSLNAGVIWEPKHPRLRGLRANIEYFQIEQFDFISTLSAQLLVDLESEFPSRVARNAAGVITQVTTTNLNLYHRVTEGWDLGINYTRDTPAGKIRLRAGETIMRRLESQYSLTRPEFDAAGYSPREGGAAKYKGNYSVNWDWRRWSAGWTARYISSYKVYGAAGGPNSLRSANGGVFSIFRAAQGGDEIPSQIYHDVFLGYAFGRSPGGEPARRPALGAGLVNGLSLQIGVRNVFDRAPPFDAGEVSAAYFLSPYGDLRMRSYRLAVRKEF